MTDREFTQTDSDARFDLGGLRGRVRGLPLARGVAFGALAFVVGYALILLLTRAGGGLIGSRDPFGLAGLVFYGAHFVSTTLDTGTGPQAVDALADLTTTIPTVVYYLVPAVVLTGASYVVVSRFGVSGELTGRAGARAGTAIALGYLPLVVVGTALFRVTINFFDPFQSGVWSVDLFSAIVLAGLVYPLAFGALGGYLAVVRPSERRPGLGVTERETRPGSSVAPVSPRSAGGRSRAPEEPAE